MRLKDIVFATSLMAVTATGNGAMAGERIYSGNFCQPSFHDSARVSLGYKGIVNLGDSPASVSCPVARDTIRNVTGVSEVWITGERYHNNTGEDFYCEFIATNHRGEKIDSDKGDFPKRAGRVVIHLTNINISHNEAGHYSIECRVPHFARIMEYEVEEY